MRRARPDNAICASPAAWRSTAWPTAGCCARAPSARIQTVHADTHPRYHALLEAFRARTGCPVLVNTSFNVRGEPIVCTPEDAFRCFMDTEIDLLVAGNIVARKVDQDPALRCEARRIRFEPD